ncbi:uncharacterized protein LOC123551746 isoform X4 [Mercenaria mercenaria]|uniref:uncharacterized protein LOC123551746 isoform X4 n=1 Tax=Mercenaria mercenaria TaxID=6596 RepID=UPI00234E4FC6|nr:uncharacterized protein LOC123551746 isoform X4 [Mercenaria mercenaria]
MANDLYLRLLGILLSVYNSSAAVDSDSFDCNFDDGFCYWKQDKTDDFDWTRWSGNTPTNLTGPDSDHTSGEGFYAYIETTRKDGASYTARLISPQKDPGQYCFSFWYHMYGKHINKLSVSKKEGTDTKELFWKTADQGKQWILGQIQFVAEESFQQIVIEGKAIDQGVTWYGDIAVDDIVLVPIEKCPTAIDRDSLDCSFDDGFCNWTQDENDDFDWTRLSGKTPTTFTGPDYDHTSGEGFYVYIETTREKGDDYMNNFKARLISPQKGPGQYCFSFWYHMYGSHINRLSVSKEEGTDTKELFLKTGEQGNKWILGQTQFEAKKSFQIAIEGKARDHWRTWYGDTAIDDIVMFPSEKCPTDCGDPTPEAGFATPMNIKIGSLVQIACEAGYEIAGNSSVICLANGTWSNRPVCQPIDCMTPTLNSAIIVNALEGTTYNMTANLSCAVGFSLIGNAYITCQADGNWTTQPLCVINNCSDPTPESGNVDDKNFQYGSVIEVTCIEGYKISGNSSIVCQANSTWSNIPVCDQIECETMNITNGHFNTTLGTTFGKTATQYCDTGYTFAGDETATCLEAGWNGTITTCTIVDSEASALVVVYAMVPVIVIVLTLVLLFVIWRKRYVQCAEAKDASHKPGEKPTIQYASETSNGYGLKHQNHVSEASESISPDKEYSFITDHNKVEQTDTTYYNIFDNICKVENEYDHTNDTSKSFSDNIYSHISRNKPGIKDETTYDTTSCQNSGNESLNTKAQTDDDSYSHLNIEGLDKAIHQKPQTTIQEEESEYANATVENMDTVETEQNDYFHLNAVKMKTRTVEKEENNHEDCEYSNLMKRTGNIETTGE